MASLTLTLLQKATIGGFLEILCMSAPHSTSYVEMMRCYALCGWNTTVFKNTAARYKFTNGTGALVDVIVSDDGYEVMTNAQVTTVNQSANGITVQTSSGDTHHGRLGVITVPMNVMNRVACNLPLSPIKREAAEIKHAGNGSKVFSWSKVIPAQ